jgi:hypothetical protein
MSESVETLDSYVRRTEERLRSQTVRIAELEAGLREAKRILDIPDTHAFVISRARAHIGNVLHKSDR